MAYTPEFTYKSSCTVRRLAWAVKMPMTKTTEALVQMLPHIVDKKIICRECKDKTKCETCVFFGKKPAIDSKLVKVLTKIK